MRGAPARAAGAPIFFPTVEGGNINHGGRFDDFDQIAKSEPVMHFRGQRFTSNPEGIFYSPNVLCKWKIRIVGKGKIAQGRPAERAKGQFSRFIPAKICTPAL